MNGLQSLMQGAPTQRPQQPQPQQAPAMPNMANPRMSTALGLVDDDLERAGIDPRTRAAMKAQEAVDLLASADADMAMGQPTPIPEKIIDQRKQQANEGVVGILQRLMPGMQQRGQQMRMQRPPPMGGMPARPPMGGMPARPAPARPPMGGMPARPAPARPPMGGMPSMGAPNMARMADGGIVGYAEGDLVKKEKLTPMQYGQQKFNHRMAMKIKDYEELKKLETKYKEQSNNAELENVRLGLERYDGSLVEEAYNSKLRYDKAKSEGMAMGGIVGYQEGGLMGPPEANMLQRMGQGLKNYGANAQESMGILKEAKAGMGLPYGERSAVMKQVRDEIEAQNQNRDPNFIERMGQKLMGVGLNVEESKAILKKFYDSMGKTYEQKANGMAMGGGVKRFQEGMEVELDPEFAAIIEEIRASAPESSSGLEASQATAATLRELFGPDAELIAAREKEAAERAALRKANLSGRDINTALERRSQQKAGRNAVGVNKPIDLVGGVANLLKAETNANFNLIDDSRIGIAEGLMGDPQTKTETTTTPEQGILERMRTNQASVTPTTRTPSALETQLETVLGGQLGALDGARDKETALAEAALGVSEAEKQAAEELVKADEAYYGKVLDPAERRRRENEVIMQAYLSGNSLVDQARRSGAAQSQLRRQGYTQEREAAKVRPQNTVKLEAQDRGIRGQVYTAGRDAEKDARSTLNQTIQTTGNYINSIENREAQIALESSRQSMQILKAEMDLLVAGKRVDQESKNMFARYLDGIQDNIVKLRQSLGDVAGDPVMGDEAISREQQTLRDAIRGLETASAAIAAKIGLPMSSQASPTGGSNVTPEQQAADAILGI